jgi:hypothetical protein
MEVLRPRIYGWRLAAGVVLWFAAALAAYLPASMWAGDPAGELPLLLVAVAALTSAIGVGFWRGNTVARWLAVLPALALFFAALAYWGLSGMCVAGATHAVSDPSPPSAISCAEPRPERSLESWAITAALAASGAVLLIGIARPGVRRPEGTTTR